MKNAEQLIVAVIARKLVKMTEDSRQELGEAAKFFGGREVLDTWTMDALYAMEQAIPMVRKHYEEKLSKK